MKTKTHCLLLDLKDDPDLIEQYKNHHREVWPEIIRSIKKSGIEDMKIYLLGNRLVMIMEVNASFSFDGKAQADARNEIVQQWETLMWKFQQPLPWSREGEKWIEAEQIFDLKTY